MLFFGDAHAGAPCADGVCPVPLPPRRLRGAEFGDHILRQPGLTVIDVAADWCMPCQLLSAFLPKLAAEWSGLLAIHQVDGDEDTAFCAEWSVKSYPHLLLFAAGALHGRSCGFSGYAALRRDLVAFIAETTGAAPAPLAREAVFAAAAVSAEHVFEAATLPAAEALGDVLEPVWPEHEAALAALDSQLAAGATTKEEHARAAAAAYARLTALAAKEIAAQREATAAAVTRFKADMDLATAAFFEATPS